MSGYILELSDSVNRKTVVYSNRYGLSITGDLYYGNGMDMKQKHPALIVGAPYGGVKEQLSRQRWVDAENGYPEYIPSFPEQPIAAVPAELEEPNAEWFRFYALKRGHHPNARGGFTTTSNLAMMNFPLLAYLDEISPRPILFVVGDRAHSKFFSENAYAAAKEPKELYTVADAEHIDLYDRRDCIPFDKLAEFFSSNLK